MPHHTEFPVLDAPRTESTADLGRTIMDTFGFVEPFIDELDSWCAMPVRLAHSAPAGWHLELGPYDLAHSDIQALREAIARYDEAVGE